MSKVVNIHSASTELNSTVYAIWLDEIFDGIEYHRSIDKIVSEYTQQWSTLEDTAESKKLKFNLEFILGLAFYEFREILDLARVRYTQFTMNSPAKFRKLEDSIEYNFTFEVIDKKTETKSFFVEFKFTIFEKLDYSDYERLLEVKRPINENLNNYYLEHLRLCNDKGYPTSSLMELVRYFMLKHELYVGDKLNYLEDGFNKFNFIRHVEKSNCEMVFTLGINQNLYALRNSVS